MVPHAVLIACPHSTLPGRIPDFGDQVAKTYKILRGLEQCNHGQTIRVSPLILPGERRA
jgi:hypothetical protein